MNEVFKDIYFIENGVEWDYRGLYQVSNCGNVKSLIDNHGQKRERILKAVKTKKGYKFVALCKNGSKKQWFIHRLVAFMFIGNDNLREKIFVNHKDENPSNNHVSNLEWCTHKYNMNYGTKNKRISEKLKGNSNLNKGKEHPQAKKVIQKDLNGNTIKIWDYAKQISKELGLNYASLKSHLQDRCKTHEYKGYLWYYLEEVD